MKIRLKTVSPSINSFYRHRGHWTYITKKGREFKGFVEDHLTELIRRKKIVSFMDARLRAEFEFYFRGKRRRDTDNYLKSTIDCLEGFLFNNDEQLDEINAKRFYGAKENKTLITITRLDYKDPPGL